MAITSFFEDAATRPRAKCLERRDEAGTGLWRDEELGTQAANDYGVILAALNDAR